VSESGDPYVYPGTKTLRNRLGLTDAADPDRIERLFTTDRATQPIPRGSFDWAGELRTIEIRKGRQQFQFRKFIETGMADVHGRLERSRLLKGTTAAAFAEQAAVIVGDINNIHPFREGNGRTQLQYLKQLAAEASHRLDLTRIEGRRWIAASVASHAADYQPMTAVLAEALKPPSGGGIGSR
jgi:cell filamentation protein, protein adenylyltransferase